MAPETQTRHSREGGNPELNHMLVAMPDWIPAFAGMTPGAGMAI